jgi:hypothetical protein
MTRAAQAILAEMDLCAAEIDAVLCIGNRITKRPRS